MKKVILVLRFAAMSLALAVLTASQSVKADPIPGDKIGIVLMQGLAGTTRHVDSLSYNLKNAGILVETPLMPWGQGRVFDKGYEESMAEIDTYVDRLKAAGAKRIFVAGHSIGGNAALGYAARRDGLSGAILLAYGHVPANIGFMKKLWNSTKKAYDMIAAGKGEQKSIFDTHDQGQTVSVYASANDLFSWFDEDGPATIYNNAPKVKPNTPILCIDGSSDLHKRCGEIMSLVPDHPKNEKVIVGAGHLHTPSMSVEVVEDWLRALKCEKPWCGKPNPSVPADEPPTELKGFGRTDCTLEELLQSKCD